MRANEREGEGDSTREQKGASERERKGRWRVVARGYGENEKGCKGNERDRPLPAPSPHRRILHTGHTFGRAASVRPLPDAGIQPKHIRVVNGASPVARLTHDVRVPAHRDRLRHCGEAAAVLEQRRAAMVPYLRRGRGNDVVLRRAVGGRVERTAEGHEFSGAVVAGDGPDLP